MMELRELLNRAPRSADEARAQAAASKQMARLKSGATTVEDPKPRVATPDRSRILQHRSGFGVWKQPDAGTMNPDRAAALSGRFIPEDRQPTKAPTQEQEMAAALSGKFTPEVVGTPQPAEPMGGTFRLQQILDTVNKGNAEVRDKIKTPTELLQTKEMKELQGHTYDMRPDDWTMLQDQFGNSDARIPEGTLVPRAELMDPPKVQSEEYATAPLTWDAYNALSSDQKKAIDLNTLMVAAQEKDMSKEWVLDEVELEEYGKKVQKIFGAKGDSDKVAPNMVKLLDTLNVQALGQDLDEYLSLERGFTMEELEDFKIDEGSLAGLVQGGDMDTEKPKAQWGGIESSPDTLATRAPSNLAAVDMKLAEESSALIAQRMQAANFAIQNFQNAVLDPIFTPGAAVATQPLGFGSPLTRTDPWEQKMEEWLQTSYSLLKTPNADPSIIFQEMETYEFTPDEKQYFLDYVNQLSRTEDQYAPAVEGAEQTRTGDEIRALLGIGG